MAVKIGINGFGRIGRNFYRAVKDSHLIDVVAVNDMTNSKTLAHLLKYDSALGRLPGNVTANDSSITVEGKTFQVLSVKEPSELPWKALGIEIVIESTGLFVDRANSAKHVEAGARKVVISAPGKDPDITICMGVNHDEYDPQRHHIISNASCTTNCLAPVVKVLDDNFGVESGFMCTTHAYTNDQRILDYPHKDLRRARAAAVNIIPTTTGAAVAVGKVLKHLEGKLDGISLRVPVHNVSVIQLTAVLKKDTNADEINAAFRNAAEGSLRGILRYTEEPLVSTDYMGTPESATVDGPFTRVVASKIVSVLAWYDNEWGYSNRLKDLVELIVRKGW